MDDAAYDQTILEDLGSLSKDPLRFVLYAFPWGEGELAAFYGPDEWQRELLADITRGIRTPAQALQVAVSSGHGIGKSAMVAWLILWALSTFEDSRCVVTANTDAQLRTKTWPEIAKWHRLFIGRKFFELTATSLFASQAGHDKTWRADLVPWSERNVEAFAGLHNKGRRIMLVFDEASAIPEMIWQTAEGALTDSETEIVWCAFGNPTRNSGRFRECFGRFRHRWLTRQIDSRSAAMSNKTQIQQWIEDYGDDSDFVRVRVRGIFPRTGALQLIGDDAVREAQSRPTFPDDGAPLVMGVDVARFGDNKSVIRYRKGRDARTIQPIKFRGLDTMQLAARIVEQLEEHPELVAILIDGAGVGGGVVDRVNALLGRRQDVVVFEVNSGLQASTERDYRNKIAECWSRMRDWMKTGSIDSDPELRDDLCGREYGFDERNRLQLERKEDMIKRGLASPDDGDALAFTFAEFVPRRDISKPKPKSQKQTWLTSGSAEGSWMN